MSSDGSAPHHELPFMATEISFCVGRGEIVGIYGLAHGRPVRTGSPAAALRKACEQLTSPELGLGRAIRLLQQPEPSLFVGDAKATTNSVNGADLQTVCIARWLAADPEVVVLDEPTAGIDIGARAAICQLIFDLARRGKSVVVVSGEAEEVLLLAHRVLVIRNGRIVGEHDAHTATSEDLMRDALSDDR
jgi:ABC-type sugar transport system ATPase subunit